MTPRARRASSTPGVEGFTEQAPPPAAAFCLLRFCTGKKNDNFRGSACRAALARRWLRANSTLAAAALQEKHAASRAHHVRATTTLTVLSSLILSSRQRKLLFITWRARHLPFRTARSGADACARISLLPGDFFTFSTAFAFVPTSLAYSPGVVGARQRWVSAP